MTSTVLKVDLAMKYPEWAKPDKGGHWAGLRVKTCTAADEAQPIDVSRSDWYVATAGGVAFSPNLDVSGWPTGKYPEEGKVAPGRCATGWVVIQVPDSANPDRVTLGLPANAVAEWLVS